MSQAEKKKKAGLSVNDRLSEDLVNQERRKRMEPRRTKPALPNCTFMETANFMDCTVCFKFRSEQKHRYSPTPSIVSLKSNQSMGHPLGFKESEQKHRNYPTPSIVSLKSNQSMGHPLGFKHGLFSGYRVHQDLRTSHQTDLDSIFVVLEKDTVTFVNHELKKLQRMFGSDSPKDLRHEDEEEFFCEAQEKRNQKEALLNIIVQFLRKMNKGEIADTVLKSDFNTSRSEENGEDHLPSNDKPSEERDDWNPSARTHQKANLDSVFKILEEKIVYFVKNELKKFRKLLNLERFWNQNEEEQVVNCKEEEQEMISKEAFLNMTLQLLRRMKQEELAHTLMNKNRLIVCHCQHKSNLKKRSAYLLEGTAKAEHPTLLNKIYTELYIVEGNTSRVNRKHEVKLIEKVFMKPARPETIIRCEDLFKPLSGSDKPVRTVMTGGVAGIGKTVLTQKFVLDWAEGKANQNFQFIFPVSFRELNVIKHKEMSLVELIHLFFSESKEAGINFEEFQVLFIFDGLDECRFPLNFKSKTILTDVTEPASLDVLLTNLIKGKLLPSARIWITTRPAAACQIPPELVDLVTDVRGFNDPQKEEYFRKRFADEEQSRAIVSHIKTSRSLHIMCHIPVFCWISATVLQDAFQSREKRELPTSLTEMYVYFLLVLSKVKTVKYDGGAETDPIWSPETRRMIQALGKLSFEQLMKGNLFFYESDLTDCDIDVEAASVYSGVFTEIFQEERVLFHQKMFCFVHLSVQEFLAALHVHLTFINTGVNLLSEEESAPKKSKMSTETFDLFYQNAVDKALRSRNGHLDLFLRFLLGLSQKNNKTLLKGFVTKNEIESSSSQNTVQYIKKTISQTICILKNNNLFYCLNELKDCSLIDEVQQTLRSGRLPTDELPRAQWAALVNVILSSEQTSDVFDLKNYYESDVAAVGLAGVVINCTKAVLSCCNLTEMCCNMLARGLKSKCLILKKLDLSNNDLKDSGVKLLCDGLQSPNCTLETLSLSGCLITKEGCVALASALRLNCSHLKELDLSYNHPEDSGVKLLSAGLEDPSWALQTLRTEPGGSQFLKPGLKKYACELILDSNTAHRHLKLSDNNRKVTTGTENPPYPDPPERFDAVNQLLGKDGLSGRCYWEAEWRGRVCIAVTYRGIKRRGGSNDSSLGMNDQSWCLLCSDDDGHSVLHQNKLTPLQGAPSNRVGVYLDWPGGSLSFFRVSSDKKTHLHTFTSTFTEPVFPAFRVETEPLNSFLFLC